MFQAKWVAFQITVAMLTLWWISSWADITKFGMAPGVIALAVAFTATGLLVRFIDRPARTINEGQKPQRKRAALTRIASLGKSTQHGAGLRIRQNISKLP